MKIPESDRIPEVKSREAEMVEPKNIMRGLVRSQRIAPCMFNADNFRDLYRLLSEKAKEAANLAIKEFEEKAHTLEEQDRQFFKERITDATKLVAYVTGVKGERVIYTDESAITTESLPKNIETIGIGSYYAYKVVFNTDPSNKFEVKLDFTKPRLLDFSNLWALPTEGANNIQVEGKNDTWVNGVYQKIIEFFEPLAKPRSWLHSRFTYDFLLWFLGVPVVFWVLFRIDANVISAGYNSSKVFLVALYVYLFLVGLILFRLLFNYARWVFPKYEYSTPDESKPSRHRKVFWSVFITIVGVLVQDIIHYLIKHVL